MPKLKNPKDKMDAYVLVRMTGTVKKRIKKAKREGGSADVSDSQWFLTGRAKELGIDSK